MIIGQRILPNVGLDDDVWVWESLVVYQILYLMLKAKVVVGLMARIMMKVTIFIKVPSGRHKIRHWSGI